MSELQLLVSCEHGGHEVPAAYAPLFQHQEAVLASHRGWDAGALDLARLLAGSFSVALHGATHTRLLVDLNRSIGHPGLYSEFTRPLPQAQRQALLDALYHPYRDAIEDEVERCVATGRPVLHIASHSFTPVLEGVTRLADVAWLYDPRRPREAAFARAWMAALAPTVPGLRLRRNQPYQGRADGLTTALRRRHDGASYLGIELELNQRFVLAGGSAWGGLCARLIDALAMALNSAPPRRSTP